MSQPDPPDGPREWVHADTLLDLIYNEILLREGRGERPQLTEYLERFPHLARELRDHFAVHDALAADSLFNTKTVRRAADADRSAPVSEESGIPGYRIDAVLGRGGMGVVYKARHLALNRTVALKVLTMGSHANEEELARFRREAEAAASLQHPGIVQIYEVGEHQGRAYLALEYVEGGTLAQRLNGAPQPPRAAALMVEALARAIHYAHQRGIIHRDLKPQNVLVPAEDTQNSRGNTVRGEVSSSVVSVSPMAKITDFGLAKRIGDDSALTQTGALLGTPSYMAPEQASGNPKDVGPAVDIYALGAILYEMLTGRPPFRGTSILQTLEQVREQDPVPPGRLQPTTPRDLETICLKCLAKLPAKRYASALALAEDLGRFLDGQPIQARPVGAVERTLKWARRRPALAALVVLGVLTGAAFWIVGVLYHARMTAAYDDVAQAQTTAVEEAHSARRANADAQANLYFSNILFVQRQLAADRLDKVEELLDVCPSARRRWEWDYCKRCCRTELLDFRADSQGVAALAFSPDGKRLACGGGYYVYSNTPAHVRVLDTATGKEFVECKETHSGPVVGLAFSPDGKRIASASTGLDFQGLARGDRAALTTPKGEVILWDADTGMKLFRWPGCNAVAFSPKGDWLASADQDRTITVRETATGSKVMTLPGHAGKVRSLAFSSDGKRLASAATAFTLPGKDPIQVHRDFKLWDLNTQTEVTAELRGHPGPVADLAFSPTGPLLATAATNTIRVWDLTTGEEKLALAGPAPIVALAFSPDGQRLASADLSLTAITLWDVTTGRLAQTYPGFAGSLTCLAFSPKAGAPRLIARGSREGRVTLWDLSVGPNPLDLGGHATLVTSVAFSRDGRRLATSGPDEHTVILWDVATGTAVHKLTASALRVAISSDGKLLATGGGDLINPDRQGELRLWDLETGQEVNRLQGVLPSRFVNSVAFSPDGKWLASASGDFRQAQLDAQGGEVRIWDVATGKQVAVHKLPAGFVYALAFSPDSQDLALARSDNLVEVCAVPTLETRRKYGGHNRPLRSIAFNPDGTRLAAAGSGGLVVLWNTATGKETVRWPADTRPIPGLAFSPDGHRLATASFGLTGNGSLTLWDAHSGREVFSLAGQTCVAFSADGHYLAAGGVGDALQANGVKLWRAK
jgi:WD40 repeat protein